MLPKEMHVKYKDKNSLKQKGQETINHATINVKKVGMAISVSDKANFRAKNII